MTRTRRNPYRQSRSFDKACRNHVIVQLDDTRTEIDADDGSVTEIHEYNFNGRHLELIGA